MKTKIVYISTLLLIACCVTAQESKYFDMKKMTYSTFFHLKGSVLPKIEKSNEYDPGVYSYDFNEDYFQRASAIFKEVFKDSEPDREFLAKIVYLFYFDRDYHIIYYTLQFPTKQLSEFPAMEEKLVRFAQLIEERLDLYPYFINVRPVNGGIFPINLGALASYLKDPSYAKTYQKNNR